MKDYSNASALGTATLGYAGEPLWGKLTNLNNRPAFNVVPATSVKKTLWEKK